MIELISSCRSSKEVQLIRLNSLVHYTVMNGIEQALNKNSEQIRPFMNKLIIAVNSLVYFMVH